VGKRKQSIRLLRWNLSVEPVLEKNQTQLKHYTELFHSDMDNDKNFQKDRPTDAFPLEELPVDITENCLLLQVDLPSLLACRLVSKLFWTHSVPGLCHCLSGLGSYLPLVHLGEDYQNDGRLYEAALLFTHAASSASSLHKEENTRGAICETPLAAYIGTGWWWESQVATVQLKPYYWWCFASYRASTCWIKLNQHERAIELLEKVGPLAEHETDLRNAVSSSLGYAYLTLGDTTPPNIEFLERSLENYRKARQTALIRYNLACALCCLGRLEEAKEQLSEAFVSPGDNLPSVPHMLEDGQLIPIQGHLLLLLTQVTEKKRWL
jgi:tetratricopeptide (TPR) repeat protein